MNAGGFGTPAEWGLTPTRHSEICSELTDHLRCIEEREGKAAAEKTAAGLSLPESRRRLAGAHLADQVYATLHRKPTREEWRELLWLGIWFVLILVVDGLALSWLAHIGRSDVPPYLSRMAPYSLTGVNAAFKAAHPYIVALGFGVWLMLAAGRAAFATLLGVYLQSALKMGTGVLLVRLLQISLGLALILLLSRFLQGALHPLGTSLPSAGYVCTSLPAWLSGGSFGVLFALGGAVSFLVLPRRRFLAVFLVLMGGMLFSTGPQLINSAARDWVVLWKVAVLSNGDRMLQAQMNDIDLKSSGLSLDHWDKPEPAEMHGVALSLQQSAQLAKRSGAQPGLLSVEELEGESRVTAKVREWYLAPLPLQVRLGQASVMPPATKLQTWAPQLSSPLLFPDLGQAWLIYVYLFSGLISAALLLTSIFRQSLVAGIVFAPLALVVPAALLAAFRMPEAIGFAFFMATAIPWALLLLLLLISRMRSSGPKLTEGAV